MEDKRIEEVKNWPEPSPSRFCQFLLIFLSVFINVLFRAKVS